MLANFLDLPLELRDQIYKLVLVAERPFVLELEIDTCYYPLSLTPQLLRTNKMIHCEATPLLYTHNHFDFHMAESPAVTKFLDTIGHENAKHLRHIRIDFPRMHNLGKYYFRLRNNSIRVLEKFQSDCPNLRTLTISLSSTRAIASDLKGLDSPQIIAEVFVLVNARLRAVSSQAEIIIETYEDTLNTDMKRTIGSYGWTIKAMVPVAGLCDDLCWDHSASSSSSSYDKDDDDEDDDDIDRG